MRTKISKRVREIVRMAPSVNRSEFVRLDKNESPYAVTEYLLDALRNTIDVDLISRYQDKEPYCEIIADYFQVCPSNVSLTAGADAGIKIIYEAYSDEGDGVLVPPNPYGMHEVYKAMFNVKLQEFDFHHEDAQKQLLKILERDEIRLIFLENPTGSTGEYMDSSAVLEIAKTASNSGVKLAIDETYSGISAQGVDLAEALLYQNVVIIKSFSKLFGLAGLRAGALIASEENAEIMRRPKPMHEISSVSAEAIKIFLERPSHLREIRDIFEAEKNRLEKTISKENFITFFGNSNFFLVKPIHTYNQPLSEFLRDQGILIKEPWQSGKFRSFYRVSIGTPSENSRLITALNLYANFHRLA